MKFEAKLKGARELDRKLSELGKAPRAKVLTSGLRAAAGVYRKKIREGLKKTERTGELAKAVSAQTKRRRRFAVIVGLGLKRAGFYGIFHEFGTSREPAKKVWRPAFQSESPAALMAFAAKAWEAIAKVARR